MNLYIRYVDLRFFLLVYYSFIKRITLKRNNRNNLKGREDLLFPLPYLRHATFLPFLITYLASRDGEISVWTFHLAFVALSNCASPRIVSTSSTGKKERERERERGDRVVF